MNDFIGQAIYSQRSWYTTLDHVYVQYNNGWSKKDYYDDLCSYVNIEGDAFQVVWWCIAENANIQF